MVDTASVSVIIPAYNVATSLPRCVESALGQNPAPLEVIVVDDGSTDNTVEIARGFGDKIKLIQQENAGQGAARNAGLAVAAGEYISFLDADDYWADGFLAATVSFMQAHPEAVAVNTAYAIRRDGSESYGPAGMVNIDDSEKAIGWILDDFFWTWAQKDHVRTGSALMRHSTLKEAGGQLAELRISQDLEYWGYIATFGPWGFIPQPLWIGDSAAHAASVGWLKRYRKRRRLCPTVEQWQSRLRERITDQQLTNFRIVRGRVAAGYAQAMILGGRRSDAHKIIKTYGQDMPASWTARVMKVGNLIPLIGWPIACALVHLRELTKAYKAEKRARRSANG